MSPRECRQTTGGSHEALLPAGGGATHRPTSARSSLRDLDLTRLWKSQIFNDVGSGLDASDHAAKTTVSSSSRGCGGGAVCATTPSGPEEDGAAGAEGSHLSPSPTPARHESWFKRLSGASGWSHDGESFFRPYWGSSVLSSSSATAVRTSEQAANSKLVNEINEHHRPRSSHSSTTCSTAADSICLNIFPTSASGGGGGSGRREGRSPLFSPSPDPRPPASSSPDPRDTVTGALSIELGGLSAAGHSRTAGDTLESSSSTFALQQKAEGASRQMTPPRREEEQLARSQRHSPDSSSSTSCGAGTERETSGAAPGSSDEDDCEAPADGTAKPAARPLLPGQLDFLTLEHTTSRVLALLRSYLDWVDDFVCRRICQHPVLMSYPIPAKVVAALVGVLTAIESFAALPWVLHLVNAGSPPSPPPPLSRHSTTRNPTFFNSTVNANLVIALTAVVSQIPKRFLFRARPYCTGRAIGLITTRYAEATSSFPCRDTCVGVALKDAKNALCWVIVVVLLGSWGSGSSTEVPNAMATRGVWYFSPEDLFEAKSSDAVLAPANSNERTASASDGGVLRYFAVSCGGARPRPGAWREGPGSATYDEGLQARSREVQSTTAALLDTLTATATTLARKMERAFLQSVFFPVAVVVGLVVGFLKVMLGTHYFSDCVAGWFFAFGPILLAEIASSVLENVEFVPRRQARPFPPSSSPEGERDQAEPERAEPQVLPFLVSGGCILVCGLLVGFAWQRLRFWPRKGLPVLGLLTIAAMGHAGDLVAVVTADVENGNDTFVLGGRSSSSSSWEPAALPGGRSGAPPPGVEIWEVRENKVVAAASSKNDGVGGAVKNPVSGKGFETELAAAEAVLPIRDPARRREVWRAIADLQSSRDESAVPLPTGDDTATGSGEPLPVCFFGRAVAVCVFVFAIAALAFGGNYALRKHVQLRLVLLSFFCGGSFALGSALFAR